MIYFVGSPRIDYIKIGFSDSCERRLGALQVGSPVQLEIIASIQGTMPDEAAVHRALRWYRTRGEWFERSPALVFLVDCQSRGLATATSEWTAIADTHAAVAADHRKALRVSCSSIFPGVLRDLIEKHGAVKVARVMDCGQDSLRNFLRGKCLPESHRMLNLLVLEDEALNPLLALVGMRAEPLVSKMQAVIEEAEAA